MGNKNKNTKHKLQLDMVLEINGNATILQPRPPPNAQPPTGAKAKKTAAKKPGRKLKDPTKLDVAKKVASSEMVISEKILERFTHVGEAFLAFDVDRSGAITEQEIKLGLHNFGFDLSDTILSNICSRFAHDEAGLINYKSFCDYFAATLEGKGSLPMKAHTKFVDPRDKNRLNTNKLQTLHDKNHVLDVVDQVEVAIRKKLAEQFRTVRHAFLFFDEDRSGRIMVDEFARVLARYGIVLSTAEMDELTRRTKEESEAQEKSVPARKKRDTIFSSYENEDEEAVTAAKIKAEKMKEGIRYEDFVRHFGKVLQPEQDEDGDDFFGQDNKTIKRGKRVGHSASHQIFGTKATATEGKKAEQNLANRTLASLDELHDALVFYDHTVSGVLVNTKFQRVLERYGATSTTAEMLSKKYTLEENKVNYVNFFSVLCDLVGEAFASHFAEDQIVLQVDNAAQDKKKNAAPVAIEMQVALELATREGLPRVISTWKLFDRAGSGKIQGGEFINALRNTRAGRTMPQRGATALSELYDLDGTGRCDYVAFSRSFRKKILETARKISQTAAMRKGSLLVNTTRKAAAFWQAHAHETAEAEKAAVKTQNSKIKAYRKRGLILPDSKIESLRTERKKSPRFRASFDTHNLVQKFRIELSPHWKSLTKAFRLHDQRYTGYVSPSRFAKIIRSKTKAIPKEQVERLALAFVDFKEGTKPFVSYNRFMKQLVLEPMRPQADGRPRRPVTRPAPAKVQLVSPPSKRPTTSEDMTVTMTNATAATATAATGVELANKDITLACMYSIYGRWKELRRSFAKMDKKRTGTISTALFCETLQKNAYAITQQDYKTIRKKFGGSGRIRYHDFIRFALTSVQNDM